MSPNGRTDGGRRHPRGLCVAVKDFDPEGMIDPDMQDDRISTVDNRVSNQFTYDERRDGLKVEQIMLREEGSDPPPGEGGARSSLWQ
jgi:hypothetical protein